jgi:hypothetical protein
MKIVSFDIGIRNLAYCVLEGTSRADVKIVDWNIIDLLSEQAGVESTRCHKCSAAASWTNAAEGIAACTKHKPKTAKQKLTKKALGEKTLECLQSDLKKLNLEVPTAKTKCVTLLYTYARQHVWLRCVKSAHSGSILDMSPSIVASMDKRAASWKGADAIAFENQMDRRMFAVQGMLHMYYTCRGFKCSGVSATHKLTNMITTDDSTGSYKGRKKTGIAHATVLVPEEWRAHMLKHPKKDDLADSFLQGLWFLEHAKA